MTQKEAIDEVIMHVGFIVEEIEEHEEFAEVETGEYQIMSYEDNKKELEAFIIVLGALDPSLSTVEGIKERYEAVKEAKYGPQEPDEPGEIEKQVVEILGPWFEEKMKENPGYAPDDFALTDEENAELAKIYLEEGGEKRVIYGDEEEDTPAPAETDNFAFSVYRGRASVIYNWYADCDFNTFPERFQEKALEFIKKHFEEGNN